jgi:hypothetical protein
MKAIWIVYVQSLQDWKDMKEPTFFDWFEGMTLLELEDDLNTYIFDFEQPMFHIYKLGAPAYIGIQHDGIVCNSGRYG